MLKPFSTKLIASVAGMLLFTATPAFGDNASDSSATEPETVVAQQTEEAKKEPGEPAVAVLTDPEIAATVEEEPDCE